MRVDAGQALNARPGDVIWIRARLPSDHLDKLMRLSVWSRAKDDEYSPHIQLVNMGPVINGMPCMVSPMKLVLHEKKTENELIFVADDNLDFCVRQEIDVLTDPRAKVKVGRYKNRTFRFMQWIMRMFRTKGK